MSACSWYNGGHDWKYEKHRTVDMYRVRTIMGETVGDKVNFSQENQRRTCEGCGLTEDKKVGTY